MDANITLVEITEEELRELISAREKKMTEQLIEEKAQKIVELIKEINALGGRVRVNHNYKSRYFSLSGMALKPVIETTGSLVEFQIS